MAGTVSDKRLTTDRTVGFCCFCSWRQTANTAWQTQALTKRRRTSRTARQQLPRRKAQKQQRSHPPHPPRWHPLPQLPPLPKGAGGGCPARGREKRKRRRGAMDTGKRTRSGTGSSSGQSRTSCGNSKPNSSKSRWSLWVQPTVYGVRYLSILNAKLDFNPAEIFIKEHWTRSLITCT